MWMSFESLLIWNSRKWHFLFIQESFKASFFWIKNNLIAQWISKAQPKMEWNFLSLFSSWDQEKVKGAIRWLRFYLRLRNFCLCIVNLLYKNHYKIVWVITLSNEKYIEIYFPPQSEYFAGNGKRRKLK